MALRLSHLVPDWMVAFFYSGLGVALLLCGLRFLGIFARRDVLALAPERLRSDPCQHEPRRGVPSGNWTRGSARLTGGASGARRLVPGRLLDPAGTIPFVDPAVAPQAECRAGHRAN